MPSADSATVDVVIVTWNSAPDLRACIESLPAECRVIVVDNGSDDDSAELAASLHAHVIALDHNTGFAAAVNVGLGHVTSDIVLLLNPDVVVGSGAIERCIAVLSGDPSIGLVGPNTVQQNGRPEPPAARRDRRPMHIVLESLGLTHLHPWFDRQTIRERSHDGDVDAVNGAFMLMRTDVLRSLGGLDDSVFMYLEDADLCRRVRDGGYRVRFVSTAHVVHSFGTSTRRGNPDAQARAYIHRLDADVELMRRYGGRGAAGIALFAYLVRSLLGLVVSVARKDRRLRYREALRWTVRQRRGRQAPPAV
ncbi:MAG: hypothetical protein QOG30_436 [Acidimicrobiaceae bacterium]|jgi:GT2 family glycosyltransferase